MQITTDYKVKSFTSLDEGSVVLAGLNSGVTVQGVKAYFRDAASGLGSMIVPVGPSSEALGNDVVVYTGDDLSSQAVVDISDRCRLAPSVAAADLSPLRAGEPQALIGRAVLMEFGVFIGARYLSGAGDGAAWQLCFLNVASGELTGELPNAPGVVTPRWRLVEREPGGG